MNPKARLRLFTALAAATVFAATGCGGGSGGGSAGSSSSGSTGSAASEQAITIGWGAEPPSLDPGLATDVTSSNILLNIKIRW